AVGGQRSGGGEEDRLLLDEGAQPSVYALIGLSHGHEYGRKSFDCLRNSPTGRSAPCAAGKSVAAPAGASTGRPQRLARHAVSVQAAGGRAPRRPGWGRGPARRLRRRAIRGGGSGCSAAGGAGPVGWGVGRPGRG